MLTTSSLLRLLCSCILIALTASRAEVASAEKIDGDALFEANRVVEIKIDIPQADWQQLCRQSRNPGAAFSGLPLDRPYTYFKADLWIDGRKVESVGVRKKGFLGSVDSQRPSLKIKFNEFKKQEPVRGLSRLTLNNNKQDGSQVSQFLAYRLFREAGNPAPRSNWAHVVVNGESLGVYSHVESIKKPFLSRNFKDSTGNLYEGTLTDFHPKAIDRIEVKTNEDENDLSDIKRLAELLSNPDLDLDELAKVIDLDAFMRHWALESLTGFWDGYSNNQNNFYLYFDPEADGRGYFIPWGADWVFSNRSPFGFGDPSANVMYAQGILPHRLYHSEGIPQRYRETMTELLDSVWNEDSMVAEIDRIEKLIAPHLHPAQSTAPQAMNEVRQFIRSRRDEIQRELDRWRPEIPDQPRTPSHVVDVGKARGSFKMTFGDADQSAASGEVHLELEGQPIEVEQFSASAQPYQIPTFGGFGGPPRGGRPGGFGGPRTGGPGGSDPPSSEAPPPTLVNVVFTANRPDAQPMTMSVVIDREKFVAASDEPLKVTGTFSEGRRGGGFGFGGFGGGPNRSVTGTLTLAESGNEPGDSVVGTFDLRIVETRGGFFQQRPRGGGGFGGPRGPGPAPPGGRPSMSNQGMTLLHALDTDRDGKISPEEIAKAPTALKRLDRNDDGQLTDAELRGPVPTGAPQPGRPARRPPLEDPR